MLIRNGLRFRDLDRDGRLAPFEDWRRKPAERAADLTRRMTLEEKAGTLVHDALPLRADGAGYDLAAARSLIGDEHLTSTVTRLAVPGRILAEQNNAVQTIAAQQRIAIPLTISTDPRNHFQALDGASVAAVGFSKWPETTGLAAIGDVSLVERFADIARQEYRASGIQQALSPMADLATEPRWSRINGTFGEDPATAARLVGAYVRGFQHGKYGLGREGVAVVVKHWVGYGASENGYDGHNWYGRYVSLNERTLRLHADAFKDAFAAGVTGVMPTYAILKVKGRDSRRFPTVGTAFSRYVLTDLLRKRYRFSGLVLSDWGVTKDCGPICRNGFPQGVVPTREGYSTAWGMEDASQTDRFVAGLNAGINQFGGVSNSQPLVDAIRQKRVSQSRMDASVRHVLQLKFRLGLFENPYVDPIAADAIAGSAEFRAEGAAAQARALTVLKAETPLPLAPGTRIYLDGVDPEVARAHALTPVSSADEAEVALVRLVAPWRSEHPQYFYGAKQHEGSLSWASDDPALRRMRITATKVPTITVVYLDRPAVLTPIADVSKALLADFGASDDALLTGLTGKVPPQGRLPFEIPSSEAAVAAQASDEPGDSDEPLYRTGYGLTLAGAVLEARKEK